MFPKMAYQIPIIKSKRLKFQLKAPLLCLKALIMGLCVIALSICSVQTASCPSSVPPSAATTTEQCTLDLYSSDLKSKFIFNSILRSFSGYTYAYTYGIAGGPVSNSLYYLYLIQSEEKNRALNLYIIHLKYA